MIIRKEEPMTLKASPFNSRRSARPADNGKAGEGTPKGVPQQRRWATPSESMLPIRLLSGGARYARTLGY